MVVGLGATRARPSRCAPRDGVLGIVALVASVLWHHLWQNASGRVPVRHTPGAATAAPSSIELLNWRTRPPISATPCVMCVMAATRRSDARTEVTSEVTQHRNVMRTSCASAASAERCTVRVRLVVGRDGRRQGFRARAAPGPRSRVRVLPGAVGVAGFRICDRGTHTSTESDCSTSTLDGGAVGRGVWGVGADARDGGRRERGPCIHTTQGSGFWSARDV